MDYVLNDLGQPIGPAVPHFSGAELPQPKVLTGRYCRIEPLDPDRHAADLFAANTQCVDGRYWTYLPYGPFETLADYRAWLDTVHGSSDPLFQAVIDLKTGKAVGVASYLRIAPAAGSIEVGHIHFSPLLQQTAAATEAMYLMMAQVFDDLGYRRYEWKCNNLNEGSKAAALRLGFTYEGCFRQMLVVKGHNRDSAWFSILDKEWPALKLAFQRWLSPDNFDAEGRQKESLSALTKAALSG